MTMPEFSSGQADGVLDRKPGAGRLFRDWFRAHPQAVPAYAAFKRSLASVTPDLDSYTDVKDPTGPVIAVAGALGPAGWAASTRTAFALRAK